VRDDAEADAVDGLDHALRAAVVANGLPSVLDAAVERRGRDVAMPPDAVEQLVLGDEPVAAGEEMGEHVEHLRLDAYGLAGSAELVEPSVELEVAEGVDHADGRGGGHLIAPASGAEWRRRRRRPGSARVARVIAASNREALAARRAHDSRGPNQSGARSAMSGSG
jgi:hypothetical protein